MRRRAFLAGLAALAALPARAKEGAPPGPQNTLRVRNVMVPVITNGQVERYATYEIALEIATPARMPEFQGMMPRLQDTVTSVVYEAVGQGWITRGVVTNGNALHKRLEEACDALLGKGTVGRVLVAPAVRSAL